MTEQNLQQRLAERVENETGVDLDPEEHVTVENGRATLTEAGAEAISGRKPRGSTPEDGSAIRRQLRDARLQFWEAVADAINGALPAWARYEGYATYALAAYVYTAVAGGLALLCWLGDFTDAGTGLGLAAIVGLLIGDYYRKAAQKRVVCDQCGEDARGNSECPHCGGPTFMGATES